MDVRRSRWFWLDRPIAVIALPAVLGTVLALLPSLLGFVPLPAIQDEFAHLLAADTFVHGRLANEPHAYWPFFEAVHVLQQPMYASKFLPGQGLFLALGQLLGEPIRGLCLCAGAAAGAIAWMMLGCLPPRWALLGGCLAAIDPLILYWADNYWGADVPLLGGALLTGLAVRLACRDSVTRSAAVAGGIGAAILLLSRPFEGGLVALLAGVPLLISLIRSGRTRSLIALVPAMLLPVLFAVIFLAYYDWRVTGSAWQLPYTLHAKQYMMAPLLFWQPVPTEPTYRHVVLWHFHQFYEYGEYAVQLTWHGFWNTLGVKLMQLQAAYVRRWWLMILPLLISLLLLRRHRVARLGWIIVLGLPVIHFATTPWFRNQYMAPAMSVYLLLIVLGLRQLSRWTVGRPIVVVLLLLQAIQTADTIQNFCKREANEFGVSRLNLINNLGRQPRKTLVFVRHSTDGFMNDVVYNGADIDAAQVVFAHDMGDEENQKLIRYYGDRQVLLLTMDGMKLDRYRPTVRVTYQRLPHAS